MEKKLEITTGTLLHVVETDAERKFRLAQEKKIGKSAKQLASRSHREKIEEYNTKLAKLTEHNDIPRVGPG